MTFGWRPSIARRLTIALFTACALVWLAVYMQGLHSVYREGSGSFDSEMLALAEAIAAVIDATPEARTNSETPTNADARESTSPLAYALAGVAATIDAEVKVLGSPTGFAAFQVKRAGGQLVAAGGEGSLTIPDDLPTGYSDAQLAQRGFRIFRRWSSNGEFRIDVLQSHASQKQLFNGVMISREGLLHPFLIGFPLLLLPVWLAVHTGLAPLRRLSGELAARKPSDLRPIQEPHVYSELAPLVHELNASIARLRELLQRERNFLSDAAHELRTPLAVISAQCDTMLQSASPQEKEEAAKRLQGGVDRSTRLVNQLLSLARLDADVEDERVDTDVADLARDCLAAHARSARARDMELSYSGPHQWVMACPPMALESVLNNLIGNAIRYGHEEGQVAVRLITEKHGSVQLQVADDGPGIAPEQRTRLFERFRRGRCLDTSGSGLGLAIVSSAARQLGARIETSQGISGKGLQVALVWSENLTRD